MRRKKEGKEWGARAGRSQSRETKAQKMWEHDIRSIILRYAELIKRALKDRKIRRTVMGIAGCVTFVTTYALILPAITLENNVAQQMPGMTVGTRSTAKVLSCEYPVHQHTDACYVLSGKLNEAPIGRLFATT